MSSKDIPPSVPVNLGPHFGGLQFDYEEVERIVAETGMTIPQVAEYFRCSRTTIKRRLEQDPNFLLAFQRGMAAFRIKLSKDIVEKRDKFPILMLATANQEHVLGWESGRTKVTGRVEHVHSLSPAERAFMMLRGEKKPPLEINGGEERGNPEPILVGGSHGEETEEA